MSEAGKVVVTDWPMFISIDGLWHRRVPGHTYATVCGRVFRGGRGFGVGASVSPEPACAECQPAPAPEAAS